MAYVIHVIWQYLYWDLLFFVIGICSDMSTRWCQNKKLWVIHHDISYPVWFTTLSAVWNQMTGWQTSLCTQSQCIECKVRQYDKMQENIHDMNNAFRQKWGQGPVKACFASWFVCMVKWDRSYCIGCAAVHVCALLLHCVIVGVQVSEELLFSSFMFSSL